MIGNEQERNKLAKDIVNLLTIYCRKLQHETPCNHKDSDECFSIHLQKILNFIDNSRQIDFVLPAFPAKSPNSHKTIGPLPDLGERLSLNFLNALCEKISTMYPFGARVIICSDGRVFNDLVKVKDEDVNNYTCEINKIIEEDSLTYLSSFGLDDYYKSLSYEEMRTRLVQEFGDPLITIKEKTKLNDAAKVFFNGIHRFILEDYLTIYTTYSKNKLRNLTKEVAYEVIQRSNSWSRFVEKKFPDAIRLSIHPQTCGSEKLGIMLLKSKDVWATPWHRVVLFDGKEHLLVRKKEAEEAGARPIFKNNQFSHYILQ